VARDELPNRWGIAVAAVVMQLCLGAAYGWSVFNKPLIASEHWTITQTALNFTLAILFLGVGTVIGGLWQDRAGPRKVATTAGVLYGVSYMLAALAAKNHSLGGLYLSYGVLGGIGMGMGYICPVATLVKWFPDKRGLMTGVAVCGYGAGALVMSPIAAREIILYGVPATFLTLGIAYFILVIAAAQFYANPPAGWKPAGWEPRGAVAKAASTYNYEVAEAMSTPQFWVLWLILFCNVSAGIMVISQASPMAQEMVGLSPVAAAGIVGLISIFNGTGRVFWAWVSDMIGRRTVFIIMYAIQAVIFFLLPTLKDATTFSIAIAIIGLCYGGGFGSMPSFTADFFGPRKMGGIYGWILLAWGAAAIPSPILIARIRQATGHFESSLYIVAVFMVVVLIFPLIARKPAKAQPAVLSPAR